LNEVSNTDGKLKSRAGLLGMLAIFFGPLVVAIWMFYNLDAWQHPEQSNYGELMLPIQPLEVFSAQGDNAQAVDLSLFKNTWTLAYVGGGGCDIHCRLQYLFVAIDQPSFEAAKRIQSRHPKMLVVRITDGLATLAQFGEQPQAKMFLIDPHANRVLRYEQGSSTKGMYGDLHKLLENSRIG